MCKSVVFHSQLSPNKFVMDDALVGAWSDSPTISGTDRRQKL